MPALGYVLWNTILSTRIQGKRLFECVFTTKNVEFGCSPYENRYLLDVPTLTWHSTDAPAYSPSRRKILWNKTVCTSCFGGPREVVCGLGWSTMIRGTEDSICNDGACASSVLREGWERSCAFVVLQLAHHSLFSALGELLWFRHDFSSCPVSLPVFVSISGMYLPARSWQMSQAMLMSQLWSAADGGLVSYCWGRCGAICAARLGSTQRENFSWTPAFTL